MKEFDKKEKKKEEERDLVKWSGRQKTYLCIVEVTFGHYNLLKIISWLINVRG